MIQIWLASPSTTAAKAPITAAEAATKEVDLVVRTPRNLVMRTPRTDRRKRLIEGTAAKHISALVSAKSARMCERAVLTNRPPLIYEAMPPLSARRRPAVELPGAIQKRLALVHGTARPKLLTVRSSMIVGGKVLFQR
jgi:hypothetical protein